MADTIVPKAIGTGVDPNPFKLNFNSPPFRQMLVTAEPYEVWGDTWVNQGFDGRRRADYKDGIVIDEMTGRKFNGPSFWCAWLHAGEPAEPDYSTPVVRGIPAST